MVPFDGFYRQKRNRDVTLAPRQRLEELKVSEEYENPWSSDEEEQHIVTSWNYIMNRQ